MRELWDKENINYEEKKGGHDEKVFRLQLRVSYLSVSFLSSLVLKFNDSQCYFLLISVVKKMTFFNTSILMNTR